MSRNKNIFKVKESYFGLFLGFIVALQFKANRIFLLEGKMNNNAFFSIFFFCLLGFLGGYYFYLRNKLKIYEKNRI
jgi:hypothetical protein